MPRSGLILPWNSNWRFGGRGNEATTIAPSNLLGVSFVLKRKILSTHALAQWVLAGCKRLRYRRRHYLIVLGPM